MSPMEFHIFTGESECVEGGWGRQVKLNQPTPETMETYTTCAASEGADTYAGSRALAGAAFLRHSTIYAAVSGFSSSAIFALIPCTSFRISCAFRFNAAMCFRTRVPADLFPFE